MYSSQADIQDKQTFQRQQTAEPKLLEMEERLSDLQNQGMEFGRLQELYSPELEEKFPSTLTAAMFTKDGRLSDIGKSQLSKEAQEAVKLTTSQIRHAKDSFGARVTNFDAQTYLDTLPTLLNSAEGRRQILRDLQIVNKLNEHHDSGVLDIMGRYEPGKINLSTAERMYREQNKSFISDLRQSFINPENAKFQNQPDASMYKGQKMVDEETGQKFRSDGTKWVLEK
jgi:hypothetical protein